MICGRIVRMRTDFYPAKAHGKLEATVRGLFLDIMCRLILDLQVTFVTKI